MRKLPAALAVLSLTALTLVGCASTSDPAASCPRTTDGGSATMSLISVSGPDSAVPKVTVNTPFHTRTTQFEDVIRGTGTVPITSGAQMVVLDVSIVSATTGKTVVSTPYDGDLSRAFTLSRWTQPFPALSTALHCATAGSRVAVAIAPNGVDPASAQSLGIDAGDSLVAVVDVRRVYLAAANGSPVYQDGWGMPAVVRASNGRPGVVIPAGPAPKNESVEVLLQGGGAKVTAAEPVLLHYTIVNWTARTVADTTWDSEPKFVTLSAESEGIRRALEGQRVGSQIMAIIPKSEAGTGASDTQIAVIDILGIGVAAPGKQ